MTTDRLLASLGDRDGDKAVAQLLEALAADPAGRLVKRDVHRRAIGGSRTTTDAEHLMDRYWETYPGCLRIEPTRRGATKVVYQPSKRVKENVGKTGASKEFGDG